MSAAGALLRPLVQVRQSHHHRWPFAASNEVLGAHWMIEVGSKQDAFDWPARCPALDNEVIEVRQVFEMSDFPPAVQKAAGDISAPKA